MLYTNHFNLMLPEGTDVVNPLVQQNPNFSDIDTIMFGLKQTVVGSATELTAGTVHTITRANTDSNIIRFTATSNWTAGDSMVIDSTPVSVYLSDGTTPGTGAYIINTEVIAILSGSRVTLIVSNKVGDAYSIPYDSNDSIGEKIDDLDAEVNKGYISVTADGIKTYSQMLDTLFAAADMTKLERLSTLHINYEVFNLNYMSASEPRFGEVLCINSNRIDVKCALVKASSSVYNMIQNGTLTDLSAQVPSNGTIFKISY